MDIGTKEYEDLKLLIHSKIAETPNHGKMRISFVRLKYSMEI